MMPKTGEGIYKGAMVYLDAHGILQVDDTAYEEIAKALRFRQMLEEHYARMIEQGMFTKG